MTSDYIYVVVYLHGPYFSYGHLTDFEFVKEYVLHTDFISEINCESVTYQETYIQSVQGSVKPAKESDTF